MGCEGIPKGFRSSLLFARFSVATFVENRKKDSQKESERGITVYMCLEKRLENER